MSQQVLINRDDLRELIAELHASSDDKTSNFLGDFKKTILEHTFKIDMMTSKLDKMETSVADLVADKNKFDGTKTVVGSILVVIFALIGAVYYNITNSIDKLETAHASEVNTK